MVSGLSTSPREFPRITSGEAKPIAILLNFFWVMISLFLAIAKCRLKLNYSSNRMSSPSPFNSCINTLKDSGKPGSGKVSHLTIDS